MTAKNDTIRKAVDFALEHGDEETVEKFGIKLETLSRYKRDYKANIDPTFMRKAVMRRIAETYSDDELRAIASGGRVTPGQPKLPIINFDGECVTFAHLTDFHMGSIYYRPEWWRAAVKECEKEGVQFLALTGDITEGMSVRPGHIYELIHLGYKAQKAYAVEELSLWKGSMYLIDGNHDRWYVKGSGAYIVEDICRTIGERAHFLGCDEGDIGINGVTFKLWHGEDGNSYATSYRVQKIVEAFTGGEKPNVLLCGHTHKSIHMFERHIHCLSGGCMGVQSHFMRSKRIGAHTGFWISRAWISKGSVNRLQATWYPFYA